MRATPLDNLVFMLGNEKISFQLCSHVQNIINHTLQTSETT